MTLTKIVLWPVNYTPVTPVTQPAASPIVITSKGVAVLGANSNFIAYVETDILG